MAEQASLGKDKVVVKAAGGSASWFAPAVMIGSFIVCWLIFKFVMGDASNFEKPDTPKPGNVLGLMYMGGPLVPLAMTMLLIVAVISIERLLILTRANGKGNLAVFVQKIQMKLGQDDIQGAIKECDLQKGSLGNVVKTGLLKYKEMSALNKGGQNDHMAKENQMEAIQKTVEEATALELPMLEKGFTIIATIVSVATLVGLIGTVLGMIRAFQALGTGEGGGGDETQKLSIGISEALINTALGISTSTIATVAYNYFTSRVDDMTYRIDEVGFSIIETFNEKH